MIQSAPVQPATRRISLDDKARGGHLLNVFLTIDTEIWPRSQNWRASSLQQDFERDILGRTPSGDFGVSYQARLMKELGLKAVFFVEALFAREIGIAPLRDIVSLVESAGHEVQLHLHPEWLANMRDPLLAGGARKFMWEFSEEEQSALIAEGLSNLRAAAAREITAFRAGNYGAGFDTLRALARHGILYDSSYNLPYLGHTCALKTPEPLLQPRPLDGVLEFPITYFQHWPGGQRHAELCACSSNEMESALEAAWKAGWRSFVIVSHSFELLKHRKQTSRPVQPDNTVVRRFERLCAFLATNRNRFRTVGFADIGPELASGAPPSQPLQVPFRYTAARMAEQLWSRVG